MEDKIKNDLLKSWEHSYSISKLLCKGGLPDKHDCEWYHSSWSLLRYLGLVSNPFWHKEFYIKYLDKLDYSNPAVIGTADFSMPYLVSEVNNHTIDLTIIDICKTPLSCCERFASVKDYKWKTIESNIFTLNKENHYDLIVNDAFLTRFTKPQKPEILSRIYNFLKPNGYYLTTIRKGKYSDNGYLSSKEKRNKFIDKSIERFIDELPSYDVSIISSLAKNYIDNMLSYPVSGEKEIRELYKKTGLKIIEINESEVIGESESTIYFQVLSQKTDR